MGIIRKNTFSYTILLKATSKNLKMLRFTLFTVLAAVAMLTEAAPGGGYYYKKRCKNLVDVADGDGRFKTLVKIVSDLGLADALKNIEKATVFAPTDAAFEKIASVLPSLTTEQKLAIVQRHVIPKKTIKAKDVPAGETPIATLGGAEIKVVNNYGKIGVSFN